MISQGANMSVSSRIHRMQLAGWGCNQLYGHFRISRECLSLILVPGVLLEDCGWEGLEPSLGPFRISRGYSWECLLLGPYASKTVHGLRLGQVGNTVKEPLQNLWLEWVWRAYLNGFPDCCWRGLKLVHRPL